MVQYENQTVCDVGCCLSEEAGADDNPLDDGIVFHIRCVVQGRAGNICRRCNDAGLVPDDETSLCDEEEDEEEEKGISEDDASESSE